MQPNLISFSPLVPLLKIYFQIFKIQTHPPLPSLKRRDGRIKEISVLLQEPETHFLVEKKEHGGSVVKMFVRHSTLLFHDLCQTILAIPPAHTNNIALQIRSCKYIFSTSLTITQFGPRWEPITSIIPNGCTTCYALHTLHGI